MENKITLIVAVYNKLEYTRNIIKCLLTQTIQVDEVIFADDGSSKNLYDYIKDLIPDCKFKIKHIYQDDIGFRLARSRNNAAKNAIGDWLVFIDQDIVFGPNFIKEIKDNVENGCFLMAKACDTNEIERDRIQNMVNEECSYSNILNEVSEDAKSYIDYIFKKDKKRSLLHKYKLKIRGAKLVGLFFVVSKKDFIEVNGLDEKYKGWGKEDDDFGNRLFKLGLKSKPIKFSENIIHMYHPVDVTKKESPNEEYYKTRKKEISKTNYKCEYGYDNSIDSDEVIVKKLN